MSKLIRLRGGHVSHDPRLDRVPYRGLDALNYTVGTVVDEDTLNTPMSKTWRCDVRLDQGREGSCTGHGAAHSLAAAPGVVSGVTHEYAVDVYWGSQKIDSYPGGAYPGARPKSEGSDVNSACRVIRDANAIDGWVWSVHGITEFAAAVAHIGPGIIGIDMYEGMMDTDPDGFIHPTGKYVGGHCMCDLGVKLFTRPRMRLADGWSAVDPVRSYLVLLNSWGEQWGVGGLCKLTLIEAAQLYPGGDWAIPTGLHSGPVSAFPVHEPG